MEFRARQARKANDDQGANDTTGAVKPSQFPFFVRPAGNKLRPVAVFMISAHEHQVGDGQIGQQARAFRRGELEFGVHPQGVEGHTHEGYHVGPVLLSG